MPENTASMHIDDFLKQSFVRKPEKGAVGEESD